MKPDKLAKHAIYRSKRAQQVAADVESRKQVFGANIYIQITEPISPSVGDIWYKTSYQEN